MGHSCLHTFTILPETVSTPTVALKGRGHAAELPQGIEANAPPNVSQRIRNLGIRCFWAGCRCVRHQPQAIDPQAARKQRLSRHADCTARNLNGQEKGSVDGTEGAGACHCRPHDVGMNEDKHLLPWYAIHVKSRHERVTSTLLEQKGFEVFLPLYRALRRWSDRYKQIDRALFPGYIFARLDATLRVPVVSTPGVVSIVGTARPIPVDAAEIHAIRVMVESGLPLETLPKLIAGDRVYISKGPVAGLEGIAVTVKNRHRLVVSVTLLNRSVLAEIDREWARPIAAGSTLPRTLGNESPLGNHARRASVVR